MGQTDDDMRRAQIFAARFDNALRIRSIDAKRLAAELGVAEQTLSNYRQGKVLPYMPLFLRLCTYLRVSPSYLLGIDEAGQEFPSGRERPITIMEQAGKDLP